MLNKHVVTILMEGLQLGRQELVKRRQQLQREAAGASCPSGTSGMLFLNTAQRPLLGEPCVHDASTSE